MVCYNIYIFNRQGACIYYHEWFRPKSVKQGAGTLADDQKQMFGLFWTLSNFCATLDPKDTSKQQLGAPRKIGQGCRFHSFTTNNYKMHFLETPSGFKLVLNTGRDTGDARELLGALYDELVVERCIKNPAYVPGSPITSLDGFTPALTAFLKQRGALVAAQPGH
mmetsp:Transcript_15221/g.37932  ORF Transcript_15221/g.37932 Transcript_15221/m.37932 type:complete len:165 (-) Transcript_15221:819-1313(-)|eukprot:CAMPEP_0202868332 /NCGR_PEP_ID=MMETSP1391-20130828/10760_1 /ASSEMBLY_ACC=CAM_ASM_000867 /TAXON_ID=1034604 /ORGANISM="Chlamydomonas leiostraca, Strain SAG 11-49" /LENGTH=164 /DNA_ID=CAMNT_0049548481 /DNA_START=76 /DNA_END=570 /DNA_ORIENTATION=+